MTATALNSNDLPIEEQMDKLRLKVIIDLVELAKLDKEWNPELQSMAQAFGEVEQ